MERETGNPVFDYRADYRRSADAVQGVLIKGGALVFVVATAVCFFVGAEMRWIACLSATAGLASFVAGVVWGFYWRNKMSAEFREKFGEKSPP